MQNYLKLIIIVASFGLLGVGCENFSETNPLLKQENKSQALNVTNKEAHPVSLKALSQKNFNGRDLKLGQVLAQNSAYTRYYITYKSGDLTISGIMNVPAGEGPFPVLILNHGYIDPAIYTNGRGLKREQDYLVKEGYIVIHPDYRNHAFSSDVEDNHLNLRLGYTEDVINAVYAVRNSDLSFFDKNKIGMLGHSMGGGITLNIVTALPNLVDAAVLFAPVSADYKDNFDKWTRGDRPEGEEILQTYGDFNQNPEFWENISPINFLENVEAPVLLHHGTSDESVPLEWSDKLNTALKDKDKNITYYVYEGEPHEFINAWPQVMQRTARFFDEHL